MHALKLRAAWVSMLLTQNWDVFFTLTFDCQRHSYRHVISSEKADKAFRRLVRYFNEWLYGRRWMRKSSHKGVIWAKSQEAQQSGVLHFHACLHSPLAPIPQALLLAVKKWWEHKYGFARFESPRSQEDVISYLTKHVGADGWEAAEIELSYNFPKIE